MTTFILIAYITATTQNSWIMQRFDTMEQCKDAKYSLVMAAGTHGYASKIECKEVGEEG